MKWVNKKNLKRCLAISLVLALISPVNFTEGVFAANAVGTGDEEQVQVDGTKHMHTFACYEGYTLECGEEDEEHVHGPECYTYPEDGGLVCSLEEGAQHVHNEDGFSCTETMAKILICEKEEHVHGEECYDEEQIEPEGSATPTPTASASESPDLSPGISPSSSANPEGEPTPGEGAVQTPSETPDKEDENTEITPEPTPQEPPGTAPEETPDLVPEATSEPDKEPETTPGDNGQPITPEDNSQSGTSDSDSQDSDAGSDNTQTDDDREDAKETGESASLDVPVPLNDNPELEDDGDKGDVSSDSSDADETADPAGDGKDEDSDTSTDSSDDTINGTDQAEKPDPICGIEEHVHSQDCYIVIYACRKAEKETVYEYAWDWADEKAQELESVPSSDADLHTQAYDSGQDWSMTLMEPKQRMTVSLLEEEYLPSRIEAVRLEIVEGENGEEDVHETREIMDVTWEIESGEFTSGTKEGSIVTLRAVQTGTEEGEPMALSEDVAKEAENGEKIDFEMLPDIRMDVLVASVSGHVSDEAGLIAAIDSKQPVIILEGSFEVRRGFNIDYDLSLYLNGCTLTYNGTDALFTVNGSGKLTIEDAAGSQADNTTASAASSFIGGAGRRGNRAVILGRQISLFSANTGIGNGGTGGKITGTGSLETPVKVDGGTLHVEGGTISFPNSKHGIYANGGTVNIAGGRITENGVLGSTENGGGIYCTGGASLNISDGSIDHNKANLRGGGIYVANGSLNIDGGTIEANEVNTNGGGVFAQDTPVNISGGTIRKNEAKNGGGIYMRYNEITIGGDAAIEENTAEELGGGIYLSALTCKADGGSIARNGTKLDGGGIYFDGGSAGSSSFTINGSAIKDNTSDGNGGGIFFSKASLKVNGGEICGNTANGTYDGAANCGGGGIFAGGELIISGGKISGNTAQCSGGGVEVCGANSNFSYSGTLTMQGGEISNNTAKEHEGGGIRIDSNTNNIITGGAITGNNTETRFDWGGGGIFVNSGAKLNIENALVTNNYAGGYGGGVSGCTSSTINILTLKGPAIYENEASGSSLPGNGNKEVKISEEYKAGFEKYSQDYFGNQYSTVYGVMLGGGSANWWGVADGKTVSDIGRNSYVTANSFMGLNANPSAQDKAAALAGKAVEISGNSAHTNGGGIMCNGTLTMGEGANDTEWYLSAQKAYKDENGKTLQLKGGEFEFWLLKENPVKDGKVILDKDNQAAPAAKNDENGYIIFKPYDKTVGTHTFYMTEKAGNDSKIIYDNRVYKIEVELEDVTTVQKRNVSALTSEIKKIEIIFPDKEAGVVTGGTVTFANAKESKPSPSKTPTPTPSSTPTGTPRNTPGRTPGPHNTPDVTPENTPTPRVTPSVRPTATPGTTPSATPSARVTPSASPSASASATPRASASASPSASASATPRASASASPSASASATPRASASASPSASASATPTANASASPDASATPTASASASPDASATPTASASASPDVSVSPGPSATPIATTTPDPRIPDSPDVITIDDEGVPRTYVKVWDPEAENWNYIPEEDVPLALPDPNEQDSPDKITIIDDEGVPKTYIKVADPDGDEDEFVYILDDGVPLGAPETADTSSILLWGGLCLTSMQGIVALWPRKKRKDEEEE